jgi:hypothetical protein
MRLRVLAVMATLCLSALPAFAQQQDNTSATPSPSATLDKVAVPIWPVTTVKLPDMQPIEAIFSLGKIEGVSPELISGVVAKGYTRKVDVENQSIGQILVVSVAKGEREETISAEGLQAQFDAKQTDSLFPEKTVEVSGSKAALVAALERLHAPKEEEKEKKETKDEVSQNPVSPGGSKNDEAASYRSPTVTSAPPEEKEPVTDLRTTTNDCPVRIDLVQGVAIQQSKIQTFTDGALTNDGECSDSDINYKLKKSYVSCPDDVWDLKVMTAWPQFQWYYLDGAGENRRVGECQKDEDVAYAITEDEDQCRIDIDYVNHLAVPQSALVYIGRNNARTQVPGHGCGPSTKSAAIPMTENKDNCPMRHEYGEGLSYELSMWTYLRDGVTYQAGPCSSGRKFEHVTVYADNVGNYICPVITNLNTNPKTVTLQSRKQITVDGVPQFVTDCTPDTATKGVFSASDVCMDPSKWTHDLAANISYGQERFYYLKADGTREYITPCQNSSVTYPHDVTITGYQNHDDQLWAYPLMTVKITVNGTPYPIAQSTVLPGAVQLPYVEDGTVDQRTGERTDEGCNVYWQTARYKRWKRPDDTEFLQYLSAGTPEGPSDGCTYSVVSFTLTYEGHCYIENVVCTGTPSYSSMIFNNPNNGYWGYQPWVQTAYTMTLGGNGRDNYITECQAYGMAACPSACRKEGSYSTCKQTPRPDGLK